MVASQSGRSSAQLRLLLCALLVGANLGATVTNVPLYVAARFGSPLWVGIVAALPFVADVGMAFAWGSLSDRLQNRTRPLALGLIGGGALYPLLPLLADVRLLAVVRLVQLLLLSVQVLGLALMTELAPTRMGAASTELLGVGALGAVGGAVAGGVLSQVGGPTALFLMAAAVCISAGLVLLSVREPIRHQQTTGAADLAAVLHKPGMATVAALLLILFIANNLAFNGALLYFHAQGMGQGVIGLAYGALILLGIPLMLQLGRLADSVGRRSLLRVAPLAYLLQWGLAALLLRPDVVLLMVVIPAYPFLLVPAVAMVSDLTPAQQRGRGIALYATFAGLGNLIGALAIGGLLEATGDYRLGFGIATALVVVGLVLAQGARETRDARTT